MKTTTRLVIPLLAAAILLGSSGCIAAIGNGESARPNVTLGQQLIDLKKAHETGAIDDTEYATQRAKLLAKR